MKKLGVVALILAILAVICGVLAFIPLTPLVKYPSVRFFSSTNALFGICGAVLAIVTLILSIVGRKKADKKGPATAGIIVSIFAIIIGLVGCGFGAFMNVITDYINETPGNALAEQLEKDPQQKQEFDKGIEEILKSFGKQ